MRHGRDGHLRVGGDDVDVPGLEDRPEPRDGLLFLLARAQGRGVIIVTGPLGNWELAGSYVAARGMPLDVIVRRMSNPIFDRYLNQDIAKWAKVVQESGAKVE